MSDDDALSGELGGYVPCDQLAAAEPADVTDLEALAGDGTGYVPLDTGAASLSDAGIDDNALAGSSVGFVAKPCETEVVLQTQSLNDADFQPQSRRITRHTTGAPDDVVTSFIEARAGIQGNDLHEDEYREFFHHEYGGVGGPTPTHVRLRTRIWGEHDGSLVASFAHPPSGGATALPTIATPYVIRLATWGTGTPTFDDIGGSVLATGYLTSNEFSEPGDPLPTYTDLSIRWPVSSLVTGFVLMIGSPFPVVNSLVEDFTGLTTLPHRGYEEHLRYPSQPAFRNYGHAVYMNRDDGLTVEIITAYHLEWLYVP